MEWITVISLILIGILLIVAELIFIPGTTVIGIVGLVLAFFGVMLGYDYFGTTTGTILLVTTLTGSLGVLVYALRNKTWRRFSLSDTNSGKFNEGITDNLNPGDEGVTISALRPMGKAEFNNKTFEVKTLGTYLESGTKVVIAKITGQSILVEPKNQ